MAARRQIVFLHLPKTGGQSVREHLRDSFPKRSMFPGTTDHHLAQYSARELDGFDIFAGHMSWSLLGCLRRDPWFFTILRDPVDRVLSFYRFLRREAERLGPELRALPANAGARLALELPLDAYLSHPDDAIRGFIDANFDNAYMYYFATRVLQGRHLIRDLHPEADAHATERTLDRAIRNLEDGVAVFDIGRLSDLTAALADHDDFAPGALGTKNAAEPRDAQLLIAEMSADVAATREHLHRLCAHDMRIFRRFC